MTEKAERGIPTSRGLLVRFTGYSLSMAQCPPGIPSNPWYIRAQETGIYFRGADGRWYIIGRRVPPERDSFLSGKSLHATIEEEDNLWITHLESALKNPRGEQQVTKGIVVQRLSDEEGIKYVRTRLHVNIGLQQESVRNLLETAYRSAKQVSRQLPAIRVGANPEGQEYEVNDMNSPQYKSILELLEREIKRVAMKNASPKVAAASAAFSKNGIMLFERLIGLMVVGGYGCLGVRTADLQEWCFD